MEDVKDQGDEELYAKLDSAYSSDEEEDVEVSAGFTTMLGCTDLC
jgi:hypothetical protein